MAFSDPDAVCAGGVLLAESEAGHGWRAAWKSPTATISDATIPGAGEPDRGGNGGSARSPEPRPHAEADLRERVARGPVPVTIRLLLVDDHAAVRQALTLALNQELDLAVVGEAGTGAIALDAIRRLQPDVVLMDINLPGMNGIDATRRIRAEFPHVQVIGFSMYESVEQEAAMRQAGAIGYVSKSASFNVLLEVIRSVPGEPS